MKKCLEDCSKVGANSLPEKTISAKKMSDTKHKNSVVFKETSSITAKYKQINILKTPGVTV